jgi:hypothetical protein
MGEVRIYRITQRVELADARSLIYTSDLKPKLLRYINSTMAFSDARVDFNKVSWNRSVRH